MPRGRGLWPGLAAWGWYLYAAGMVVHACMGSMVRLHTVGNSERAAVCAVAAVVPACGAHRLNARDRARRRPSLPRAIMCNDVGIFRIFLRD